MTLKCSRSADRTPRPADCLPGRTAASAKAPAALKLGPCLFAASDYTHKEGYAYAL